MLQLPIAAQVLVPVGTRKLVVAVVAGHHQQLLELLRRLRQREELARLHAAGHHEVARPLGRAANEGRGLDLDESDRLQAAAHGTRQARAQQHPLLERWAPQVQVAIGQAQRLVEPGLLLVDVERRHFARVEHGEGIDRDLDFTGRQLGVGRPLRPMAHHARNLHHPLVAGRLGCSVGIGRVVGVGHHLGDPIAVAQVEEGQVAVVTAPMHPTGERHPLANVRCAQLTAGVGSERLAHGRSNGSGALRPDRVIQGRWPRPPRPARSPAARRHRGHAG